MRFCTITTKYAGTCQRCGQQFPAGTRVRYGRGRCWHLSAECPATSERSPAEHRGEDYVCTDAGYEAACERSVNY